MKYSHQRGFLVLEILIAGLILTASIAATMYLFRMGYEYLEKANQSNVLSSKLIEAAGLLKALELENKTGTEDMGNGVTLAWKSRLLRRSTPAAKKDEFAIQSPHEISLYRVDFHLGYRDAVREYQVNVFRYKPLFSPENL
jgi:hypothetical protein